VRERFMAYMRRTNERLAERRLADDVAAVEVRPS
jgi:hypothetical protein